jgi:hypothetical protein
MVEPPRALASNSARFNALCAPAVKASYIS